MASSKASQVNQVTRPKKSRLRLLVWAITVFFWMSIIIPILGSIFSNAIVLPDAWKQAMATFSCWIFGNPPLLLSFIVIMLLCTIIAFLLTRDWTDQENSLTAPVHLPAKQPDPVLPPLSTQQVSTDVREKYLRIMLQKNLSLNLQGIPTPYRLPNVLLEEVFIPLEFLPRQLDSDYEITKEEGLHYLELEQKGTVPEELEQIFIDREHRLLDRLKGEQRISISELWQRLDRRHATAVIQGQPGMGKSTLLARLTLHFARLNIGEPDDHMSQPLDTYGPAPIPILLILKDYATEYKKAYDSAKSLSVLDYLLQTTKSIDIPELFVFLKESLTEGRCLVLFDGLDEISDLTIRRLIRGEIEHFIVEYSAIPSGSIFNRFLITSRIAGYEVVVFQHYQHITVATLTEEQIKDFLPRWCCASLPAPEMVGPDKYMTLSQEANLTAQRVMGAVTTSLGARKIADNPLLLTLLVVLQQNRVELPRQRWKLYSAITTMMLEDRNSDKFLPVVDEKQAIKRLGPIAYDMQARNNNFASKRFVNIKLSKIIADEGSGADSIEIDAEVKTFLFRIRERSGLFVVRTGDYYGFFHRTFQEYFAARYILDQVKRDAATWIATFVEHARHTDDLWREPFLLAIAYQSGEDETIAQEIITALLDHPLQDSMQQQTHDLLLAAECLLEAKLLGRALEVRIAEQLLQTYEQALRMHEYQVCENIERVVSRLLLNLSPEAFRPALLDVLCKKICVPQQIALQRATLMLLTMIVQDLREGPNLIFTKLIPPLLSLTGLSAVGKNNPDSKRYDPDPEVACASNFDIADLALNALSFMDKRGPAGVLLLETRRYFKKEHPAQLRQLALFSLQSGTLITPAVVPLPDENYKQYEAVLEQWQDLKKRCNIKPIAEDDIDACVLIHEALLACAEEVTYPITIHIQHMLQASENDPANWHSIWQDYLLNQLNSGHYVSYQESALLWAMLFPSEQEQKKLATIVMNHINNDSHLVQCYGLRLMSSLTIDLRNLRNLMQLRESRDLRNLKGLRDSMDLIELRSFIGWKDLRVLRKLINLRLFMGLIGLKLLRNFRALRGFLFIGIITNRSIFLLTESKSASNTDEQVDILTILVGRLLYIIEAHNMGENIEQEIRQITRTALYFLDSTNTQDIIEIALDILRFLPTRTANEITFVLQQAECTTDQHLQTAYRRVLRYAEPYDKAAWDTLAEGQLSHVQFIQEAVEAVLKKRKARSGLINRSPTPQVGD